MISKYMKEIRKARKLTQEELARKTEISVKQIQKYESDFGSLCKCKITTSKKIAKALRCRVEDIAPYEEIIKWEQEQKTSPKE
ncbi:helix-turn-helix transcriptional regulator [Velocimicrobium porci]|uniref:Helix-turn-helix transcriptional regulator n=1 Tax=Velocimicrobium porci TaxID=2606634 RepID=A0A6L5Y1A5_9FIRM|nr:helix-turn-helix transcriptional regulator [Velocimicrobium porci]MSS64617.1 helix-turn-helix transcriptional regulator [Velocimicrobium porci]